MITGKENIIEELSEFFGGRRGIDVKHCIACFCRRHVMSLRAHTANAGCNSREFLDRPSDAELLEASQFRNLEVRVFDFSLVIEENIDLAVTFKASNGIYFDLLHTFSTLRRIE